MNKSDVAYIVVAVFLLMIVVYFVFSSGLITLMIPSLSCYCREWNRNDFNGYWDSMLDTLEKHCLERELTEKEIQNYTGKYHSKGIVRKFYPINPNIDEDPKTHELIPCDDYSPVFRREDGMIIGCNCGK